MTFIRRRIFLLAIYCACCYRCSECFVVGTGKVCRRRLQSTKSDTATVTHTETTTDRTIVVPRYFPGDVDIEGAIYPSFLHKIHVVSLLSDEEARTCLTLAKQYAAETGCWDKPDFDRHSAYATCDFPIKDENNNPLAAYLDEIRFDDRMWDLLSERFRIPPEDMSYLDHFCAHYRASPECSEQQQDNEAKADLTMDRLDAHRDGSLISFTVLLNSPEEFTGGGTFFDALTGVEVDTNNCFDYDSTNGVIRPSRAGDACLHSGKLLHGGDVVTSGERTILIGFIDLADWWVRPGSLGEAAKLWGRVGDVANHRLKRQQKMTDNGQKKGWFLNNYRWLPDQAAGKSSPAYVRGYCPAFPSVEKRAEAEYQRIKKLEIEDQFLRSVLLETPMMDCLFDGDISIL